MNVRNIAILASLALAPVAFATDAKHTEESSMSTSTNPVTGTTTTTKKHMKAHKAMDGTEHKMEKTHKSKVHSDGSMKKTTESTETTTH